METLMKPLLVNEFPLPLIPVMMRMLILLLVNQLPLSLIRVMMRMLLLLVNQLLTPLIPEMMRMSLVKQLPRRPRTITLPCPLPVLYHLSICLSQEVMVAFQGYWQLGH